MLAVAPHRPRRLVFLGTPQSAVPPLEALHEADFDIALVVTRPDARRGRGVTMTPSPVKEAAERLGLPVSHSVDDVLEAGAELGVVVAYGRLIRRPVLERLAFVNVHFSHLPRWRGAAPVERAILAGDTETGVCLMALEEGLDTGPVYASEAVAIGADTTADELRAQLVEVGTAMLIRELTAGLGKPVPQVGEPTYAAKVDAGELHIDWGRPAAELERLVRVGGAWTTFRGGRLRILRAGVEDDTLVPIEVQPEGKAAMSFTAWRNGARVQPGERLGS
ncbi:MAG: methionyl-tRNA formyltransferase [Acidimicrobiales bacterium]